MYTQSAASIDLSNRLTHRYNKVKTRTSHTKKTKKVVGKGGLTLPGYNYLGPGNSVKHGVPTNYTDSIAQLHDIAYYQAKSADDIRTADKAAIHAFGEEYLESGTTGALLGAEGLIDKYAVESLTVVLYPRTFDGGDVRAMYYAGRQTAISKLWKEQKARVKAAGSNYREWLRTPEVKAIYRSYARGGADYNRLRQAGVSTDPNQPGTSRSGLPEPIADSQFDEDDFAQLLVTLMWRALPEEFLEVQLVRRIILWIRTIIRPDRMYPLPSFLLYL